MKALIIRNGANGISVFIFIFPLERNIIITLTIVPSQNDNIIEKRPADIPSIQPIPRTNFPSPSPISRPLEKNQRRTNGKANRGPEIKLAKVGRVKTGPNREEFTNMERKEIIMKIKTNLSGIIL